MKKTNPQVDFHPISTRSKSHFSVFGTFDTGLDSELMLSLPRIWGTIRHVTERSLTFFPASLGPEVSRTVSERKSDRRKKNVAYVADFSRILYIFYFDSSFRGISRNLEAEEIGWLDQISVCIINSAHYVREVVNGVQDTWWRYFVFQYLKLSSAPKSEIIR